MNCALCEKEASSEELSELGICSSCQEELGDIKQRKLTPELQKVIEFYNKRREYMKKYNERPDVAGKRKAYMRERARHERMLIKKAKELGLLKEG